MTSIDQHFASHVSRLSTDDRLGASIWKVTLRSLDTTLVQGYVAFRDNDADESEVIWSDEVSSKTGLTDALWTIKPGPVGRADLILYSNGDVLRPVGSLLQGRYTLTYTRNGKRLNVLLERP